MGWSEEDVLKFIELYRSEEVLWNVKHKNHYNKTKKSDAWDAIAKEIGKTAEECRKKIISLLSSMRREKSKIRKSKGTRTGDVYVSNWFAFKSLAFLWDNDRPRKHVSSMPDDRPEQKSRKTPQITASDEDDESQDDQYLRQERMPPPKRRNPPKRFKKSMEKTNTDDSRLRKAILGNYSLSKEDEYDIFGKLIAAKLRNHCHAKRILLQQSILNLMFDADREDHFPPNDNLSVKTPRISPFKSSHRTQSHSSSSTQSEDTPFNLPKDLPCSSKQTFE